MRRRPAPPALGLVQLLTDRNVAIIIITYIKTQMYYRISLYKCKHEHYVIFNTNLIINEIFLLYSRNAFPANDVDNRNEICSNHDKIILHRKLLMLE